ncbi:MAG: hypothetical protein K2K04_02365 [Clostridia bacterium]|nr:hypothetical protein [Clostridia bacterium]
MRWTKRLKWIRASKIIIPIALAISLVFAGFSVYAKEAEYFVLRVNNGDGVNLALAMKRDLSDATPRLLVPVNGGYDNVTWTPDKNRVYEPNRYGRDLPDDIAQHDGEHSIYETNGRYSFYSFSFWLINKSNRAVDVDMRMDIDSITVGKNDSDIHIDEAIRVMVIEGDNPGPRLSDNTYMIYKKAEKTEEAEKELTDTLRKVDGYDNTKTISFESDLCIFNNEGDWGIKNLVAGETKRFTIVVWLEGWDPECIDPIIGERLKMSMSFTGH